MITSKPIIALAAVVFFVVFLPLRNYMSIYTFRETPKVDFPSVLDTDRVANATLGFEKIMVIGLKERSDKRDAIALQSSLTGFQVDWIDGVKGEEVVEKAVPKGMDKKIFPAANLGSWRGHMNAVASVIERNLSSALIMEDDVDWDIRLKSQLSNFASGVRAISNIPISEKQHSPYGDDWDILWPGHCGEVLPEHDDRRYVINDDETVPPKEHQPWLKALADYPEQTRIVHKTGAPICTFAYAVSLRGAQKILWALGMSGSNLAYDNALAYFCRDGYLDIKCVSVQPMLFFHHRPAGAINKDSDIQNGDEGAVRERGFTENIVWSTRLNIEKLLTGSKDYVMQW
ncbi:Procollagen galactosyltransferase 1 [Phlyctema vagabunda]|uniref:Procollagen galactosyltransferase 1 n=1 Tax=Phlyctema vagabunda TaxID=108571 RepID=A0ABR4P6C3_9HELO